DGPVILEEQAFLQADVDLLDALIGGHAVLALVELLDSADEEALLEGLDLDQLEALRHALDEVADLGLALHALDLDAGLDGRARAHGLSAGDELLVDVHVPDRTADVTELVLLALGLWQILRSGGAEAAQAAQRACTCGGDAAHGDGRRCGEGNGGLADCVDLLGRHFFGPFHSDPRRRAGLCVFEDWKLGALGGPACRLPRYLAL